MIDNFTNNIFNTAWEETLPSIPDNSVDIVITSPPYNVNLGNNKHKKDKYDTYDDNMPYEDYLDWMDKLYTECYRLLKSGGRICINIGDGANGCYDDKTEIMTQNGWKFFKDLSKEDKVITMNPFSHKIEWQYPTEIQNYAYDGELYHISSSRTDLMVTPNHRMFIEKHHTEGWHFCEASDMTQRQYYLPGAIASWENKCLDFFTIPSLPLRNRKNKIIPEKQIKTKLFAEFLGWYLSEGCSQCNQKNKFAIHISQDPIANKENYEYIYNCLKRMGYNPHKKKNGIRIHDKQLCVFLEDNVNKYAKNKNIPLFVMGFSKEVLEVFFDAMIKGDGCYHCNGQIRFYSSSKKMAEQMQAIGLKIGKISTISSRFREKGGKIKGREIKNKLISYEVTYSDRKRLWIDTKKIKKTPYVGKVYCCSVPNTIIYVKRNNFSTWCGNSVPTHADFMVRMRDNVGFIPMTTIVWDKKQIGASTAWGSYQSPSCPSFPTQFEFILVMAKDTTHHEGDKDKITVDGKEFQRNSRALWAFLPETRMMKEYGHPAMFPEELPRRLLQQLTYKNDIVLDPFSGAGTTCAVAKQLGRRYIGTEMSKKYYETSLVRLGAIPEMVETENGEEVPDWMA